jgi:hypothetical protein
MVNSHPELCKTGMHPFDRTSLVQEPLQYPQVLWYYLTKILKNLIISSSLVTLQTIEGFALKIHKILIIKTKGIYKSTKS